MSIKFLVLRGRGYFGFGGGGSADFIFMGARIFLRFVIRREAAMGASLSQCRHSSNQKR